MDKLDILLVNALKAEIEVMEIVDQMTTSAITVEEWDTSPDSVQVVVGE